jgi:hypothetical protein
MKTFFPAVLLAAVLFQSCKPKPIDIAVPQQQRKLAISSAMYDEHTLFVSAGYSVSSMQRLSDTTSEPGAAPGSGGLTVNDGLVTITDAAGRTDTLPRVASGLYGNRDLRLSPGARYTLRVLDRATGIAASAETVYEPTPQVALLQPRVQRSATDTAVRLRYRLEGVQPGEYYFVSYTSVSVKGGGLAGKVGLAALNAFEPRKLELISGSDALAGVLENEVPLFAKGSDSLYVHCGRIEKAYFEYLAAYKRSGNLVSQLSGEPVHLPANIRSGYGYFALYLPERRLFDLSVL